MAALTERGAPSSSQSEGRDGDKKLAGASLVHARVCACLLETVDGAVTLEAVEVVRDSASDCLS